MARVVLVDPKAPRRTTQGRAKTDRIDARALARLLAAGFFAEVWAPDEATRARRRLTSRRAQLVHQRTREKNQVHAVLYRGLVARPSMSDIFGVAGRRWLSTLELPPDEQLTLAGCLRQIDALNGEIAAVEREIARRVLDSPEMRRLLTIPGVNAVSACALVGAIGDVSRFASSRQLVAYLGLDPRVEQSGPGPARHGRISKQGPGRARHVLVEAAWHLARSAGPLRAFHERVRARLRGQRGHRRRGAQAGGDLLAHAAPRRGLRLRPPALTRQKIRRLELMTGAPRRRGHHPERAFSPRAQHEAERELAAQAETAYRRLMSDWQLQPTRVGAGATRGRVKTPTKRRGSAADL